MGKETKKVCIMGGGVGGLAVAHELAKYPHKFDVILLERNSQVGGQARSKIVSGKHSEYCWHAISNGYVNLAQTLQEIAYDSKTSVFDQLKPVQHYNYITDRGEIHHFNKVFLQYPCEFYQTLRQITGKYHLMDCIRGLYLLFYAMTSCKQRIEALDSTRWIEFNKNLSPEMRRWVVDSTSIFLGMDYSHIGSHLMLDLLRHTETSSLFDPNYSFYCFSGPINQVWFNKWEEQLIGNGVDVRTNHSVQYINMDDNQINSIQVRDANGEEITIEADIFVNALPTEALARLIPRIEHIQLSRLGTQIQTQVLYYVDHRLPIEPTTVFIFHQSPWFLMTRHEGSFWDLKEHDLLSCGIGMWDVPGLCGKTALECTPKELAEECWNQMLQFPPKDFPNTLPEWNVWDTFKFTLLTTEEPKFSNNSGTLKLRPHAHDRVLNNLYHATSYTRTNTNIFNMESGIEAGVRVANLLGCEKSVIPVEKNGWLIRWIRKLDAISFRWFC